VIGATNDDEANSVDFRLWPTINFRKIYIIHISLQGIRTQDIFDNFCYTLFNSIQCYMWICDPWASQNCQNNRFYDGYSPFPFPRTRKKFQIVAILYQYYWSFFNIFPIFDRISNFTIFFPTTKQIPRICSQFQHSWFSPNINFIRNENSKLLRNRESWS
jgi:hypothetical protein